MFLMNKTVELTRVNPPEVIAKKDYLFTVQITLSDST